MFMAHPYQKRALLKYRSKHRELMDARSAPLLHVYIHNGNSPSPQLVRVITKFSDAANTNLNTTAVPLDVSKAFD